MSVRPAYRLLPAIALLAACSTREERAPVVAYTPPPAVAAAPAFAGYGNLAVPPRLADGSYATPNRNLSAAGAIWHLRAGLNVAALGCRGADEAALVAGYNALLARHRAEFATAYTALSREFGNAAAFDTAMTRLYNYYALPPAQPGLCAAARAVLADSAMVPTGGMGGFAGTALARLDGPYVTIFAQQEGWLATRYAAQVPAATISDIAYRK
jgi:hypothetical protein